MSVSRELIMPVDRTNGQPLWWKNLISAHSKEGYKTRFFNIFYSYRNETYATMNSGDTLWSYNDFINAINNLRSNNEDIKKSSMEFLENNIIFFLSLIDGIIENSEKITFDIQNNRIYISFKAELDNGDNEMINFSINI